MNKLKLEVKRLLNDDVIATSLCKEKSGVAGVAFYAVDDWYYKLNDNEDSMTNLTNATGLDTDKFYHVDKNGDICGDCPCQDDDSVLYNHGVECLIKGTKITMFDGSLKNIENIKVGDKLLTFNHFIGKLEPQEVYFTYKGETTDKSFTLKFNNGTELSICGVHDLFEKESNKYVRISNENAKEFVGKHFYNTSNNEFVELLSVTYNEELTDYYSIYAANNFNTIANGMLSLPDDIDYMLNIFDFNVDLTVNKDTLNKDIEKYGLFEFKENDLYSKEDFEIGDFKYINICKGKGLITEEKLLALIKECKNN